MLKYQFQTSELPQPCALPPEDEKAPSTDAEKMKIAWRYEGLSQVESSFGSNTNFGHNFDLSRYIDADTIEKSKIQYGTTTWQDSTLSWQTTMRRGIFNILFPLFIIKTFILITMVITN